MDSIGKVLFAKPTVLLKGMIKVRISKQGQSKHSPLNHQIATSIHYIKFLEKVAKASLYMTILKWMSDEQGTSARA